MTFASYITLTRVLLIPLIIYLTSFQIITLNLFALLLFLVASLTDYFDGKIARKTNTETSLGDTPLTFADGNGLNRFKYLDGNNISDVETEIVHLLKVKMGRMDTMTINNEG